MRTITLHWMILATLPLALGGCRVFDSDLYMGLPSADGGIAEDGGGSMDAPAADAGEDAPTTADAGPPRLVDTCTDPELFVARSVDMPFRLSTEGFEDDIGCSGSFPGPEGFFAIEVQAGERWHFHIEPKNRRDEGPAQDPVVYALRSCDPRAACGNNVGARRDLCLDWGDEHFTFEPDQTGTWLIAIDDRHPGGGEYDVLVVNPICGDGLVVHNETCTRGDIGDPNATCGPDCRPLLANNNQETEPNDDWTTANVLQALKEGGGAAMIQGGVGGQCDTDLFGIDVPLDGDVSAVLLPTGQTDCTSVPAETAEVKLTLLDVDGRTVLGGPITMDGTDCARIDPAVHPFAAGLDPGLYFLQVDGTESRPDVDGGTFEAFAYDLGVEVAAP